MYFFLSFFLSSFFPLGEDGVSGDAEYVHSPVGLFPVPLGPSTRFSIVEEICSKFKFLGKLMAKATMDSRMVSRFWVIDLLKKGGK